MSFRDVLTEMVLAGLQGRIAPHGDISAKFLGTQLLASGHLCEVDRGLWHGGWKELPRCLHWVSAEMLSHL